MRVLFVSSGNNHTGRMAPFVESQGESLKKKGIELSYLLVKGSGLRAYLSHVPIVRKAVQDNDIDVIHAHYSLCAATCLFARTGKPVVASYMGSDAYGDIGKNRKTKPGSYWLVATSIILQPFISFIVCKSESIKKFVFKKNSAIIPNGVDLGRFQNKEHNNRNREDPFKILFLGNPKDQRKNFILLKDAVDILQKEKIEIVAPYPIPASEVASYLSDANLLAMCSLEKGSPNVVKEAMACGLPIVSTNAGDAWWLLGDIEGHYKAGFEPKDYAKGIKEAMNFKGLTDGRKRLIELGLDASVVADRLIEIYKSVIKRSK